MAHRTHGMTRTADGIQSKTYGRWSRMKQRCYNRKDPEYVHYGGRGVKVCDRWWVFENFYADMGECPKGKSLDRYPNQDGNYEPGNCRWATPKEQNENKRVGVQPTPIADAFRDKIKQLSQTGLTTRKIAALTGVSKSYVHRLIRDSGTK
jgi:hypothetical protein